MVAVQAVIFLVAVTAWHQVIAQGKQFKNKGVAQVVTYRVAIIAYLTSSYLGKN